MGGVESTFRLLQYKVDLMEFHIRQDVGALLHVLGPGDQISYDISFRQPLHLVRQNLHVAGLEIRLRMFRGEERAENEVCAGRFGILGVFAIVDELPEPEILEKMVKVQFPALLLPYLRAAITSTLAHAGFGSVIMPLINVHALAEKTLHDVSIQQIDKPDPSPAPGLDAGETPPG